MTKTGTPPLPANAAPQAEPRGSCASARSGGVKISSPTSCGSTAGRCSIRSSPTGARRSPKRSTTSKTSTSRRVGSGLSGSSKASSSEVLLVMFFAFGFHRRMSQRSSSSLGPRCHTPRFATRRVSRCTKRREPIEWADYRPDRGIGDSGVKRRGVELGVAEQDLDDADVGVLFQQVCGEAVPQRMWRYPFLDPGSLGGGVDGAVELTGREWFDRLFPGRNPVAQREPEIKPDNVLDDRRREAMSALGELIHAASLPCWATRSNPVSVTLPARCCPLETVDP
jgi:hypothetical protein